MKALGSHGVREPTRVPAPLHVKHAPGRSRVRQWNANTPSKGGEGGELGKRGGVRVAAAAEFCSGAEFPCARSASCGMTSGVHATAFPVERPDQKTRVWARQLPIGPLAASQPSLSGWGVNQVRRSAPRGARSPQRTAAFSTALYTSVDNGSRRFN